MSSLWIRCLCAGTMYVTIMAQAAPVATPQEFKAMEPACQAIGMGEIDGVFWAEALNRQGRKDVLDKPENAMAKGAVWFHHYCWGKLAKYRFFSEKTNEKRNFQTKTWRNEMQYIVDWTNREKIDWPYLALVHKEISESYFFEKRYALAIGEAGRALKKDPDYPGAYSIIADSYEAMRNIPKALEYVTEGLRRNPASKPMQKRYMRLGGKKPYPTPYPKSEIKVAEPSLTIINESPPSLSLPGNTAADSPDQSVVASPPVPDATTPKPNPYCRFCP